MISRVKPFILYQIAVGKIRIGLLLHLMYILATKRFEKLVHVFHLIGHTMLPSNRDFALVENFAKRRTAIYSSSEWEQIFEESQKKNPFIVTKMARSDF